MEKIRYFDHAATTPVSEEVLKSMLPYFNLNFGNPSSMYSIGRKNKRAIEDAREKVAKAINAHSKMSLIIRIMMLWGIRNAQKCIFLYAKY